MQLFVRAPTGVSHTYTFDADASIDAVKAAVEDVEFIPSAVMRLQKGAKSLACGSLADLGLVDGDALELMLEVPGGMRKKWRKKRMRRLRRKRRKMRQRAR